MSDDLTEAINAVDLPALVAELHPESGAKPGTADLVRAAWRGDRNPSFSLYRSRSGIWMFKDHALGQEGNAFHFLRDIIKQKPQEAARFLMDRVGILPTQNGHAKKPEREPERKLPASPRIPLTEDELDAVEFDSDYGTGKVPRALLGRGITDADCLTYGIYDDDGDAVFRILETNGVVVGYKRRYAGASAQRYGYEFRGHGSPAWCNPGFGKAQRVLVVEGELNALIAHSVLSEEGISMDVMGIAGANGGPYWDGLKGKNVYVYADGDKPGQEARATWLEVAKEAGAESAFAIHPIAGKDFCDIAGESRKALVAELANRLRTAQASFTSLDSRIGYYSRAELLAAAKRFVSGAIINPMGFSEIDRYTGGMPESGITLICGLPSMGKSVLLRDVLANHLEQDPGNKVMLFSPDQSAPSVMRLLAARRSGLPSWRVREGEFTPQMLELHGTPANARKHWHDVYEDTVMNYSRRFIVSEEQHLPSVKRAMLAGAEDGVTLFGGDYLQTFELEAADGTEVEGKAIRDFKNWTREHKVSMVFATQLAKYKFGSGRKSGIPYSSDIEGTGKVFQSAEQCYMIYNYDVYTQEADEKEIENPMTEYQRVSAGRFIPLARIYVRKNREGMRNDFFYLIWDREVPRFIETKDVDELVTPPFPWRSDLLPKDQ